MALAGLRQGWRVGLLCLCLAALFAPVLRGLLKQWDSDPNYSHGFAIPLIVLYILWLKRPQFASVPAKPSLWGLALVFVSVGLLLLGSLGAELFLTRVAFWGAIVGCLIYFHGWPMARHLRFPLAYLLFMIPLPALVYNEMVFPLQLIASRFATGLLETLNLFPVLREGNLLVLPGYTLEVVDACSGIRSLLSLLAIATAYVYLVEKSAWVRWTLVALMVPLAIVSNSLRVVITAILTNRYGPGAAEGFLHTFSGWMIFVAAMGMMLVLHGLLNFGRRHVARRPA